MILGIILNKTDKRTQQFCSNLPAVLEVVNKGELPTGFDRYLPDTPKLATATDETIDFPHAQGAFRHLLRELKEACTRAGKSFRSQNPVAGNYFRVDSVSGCGRFSTSSQVTIGSPTDDARQSLLLTRDSDETAT